MLSQSILREQFQTLLGNVQQAEGLYDDLTVRVKDNDLQARVEQLRRDKARHVSLAERLLEIIE